jgi:integrase
MGKLTVRAIEAAKRRIAPYKLIDGDGLQLRVAPDGRKTWLIRYSIKGEEHQYTLPAPYGDAAGCLGLEAARTEARTIRVLAASGVDYRTKLADERETERQAREERERRLTVRRLFDQWASVELAKRKDGGAETRRGLEKDVLTAIGDRAAETITRADVMQILDGVRARGADRLANRMLAELRQMFGFGLVREMVKTDPTAGIKKRDVGGTDIERDRVLSETEIRALPAALAAAALPHSTVHAVWVMLATCCRIGELVQARLDDIDLQRGVWTLPDTKNGKPHTVYLSDFAQRHMVTLIELADDGPWLLAATDGEYPACPKSITKQIGDRQRGQQAAKRSGKTASLRRLGGTWVPHDLRRTGATLMGELGVSSDVIEKCLNHTEQSKVKRTYQRAVREQEQRHAWRLLGERLNLLTTPEAADVALLKTA